MTVTVREFSRCREMLMAGVGVMRDPLKMMLIVPGHTYDASMVRYSDLSGVEVAQHVNYQAGGVEVDSKDVVTNEEGKAEVWLGEVQYVGLIGTVRYAVLYAQTTVQGIQDPLLLECDFGTDLVFDSATFRFTWPDAVIRW